MDDTTDEETVDPTAASEASPGVIRANRTIAVVLMLISAVVIWQSLAMGVGILNDPAAGSWPLILGVVLGISAVAIAVRPSAVNDISDIGTKFRKPLLGIVSVIAYGLLLPVLGFELLSLALMIVWLRFLGGESWRSTVIGSVVIVVVLYLIFIVALAVPIPRIL
ncbi:tripartite tricarboxylate transporter TctB family protein [Brevibacterium sanguinis]|uniref:Tripartite tricarboxylate transporter TctB family protein n=2 Tax=Brevibacterium TaxID=1696 RepID=A0A366IJV8_9MICO|nr:MULTISPECIES: tripartite tricarboxylate transporter TctB family protein [Brevibacterium]RBP64952.1 tripartite tricarboxylate transporter TctB family protein [Brevibacterium sanguinis]RBP71215.1 tripartite tricarboxylate transporter TctB family protein [Brevibacterium celere]